MWTVDKWFDNSDTTLCPATFSIVDGSLDPYVGNMIKINGNDKIEID